MPGPHQDDLLDAAMLGRLSRLTVAARWPMLGTVSGIHRSATRGSSVEFAEYRKYAAGDDIRHLDWRVYARTDRFYMKEFEADTNLRCWLLLDASGSMAFAADHGSRLDYARRLVATVAWLLAQQGDAVGLGVVSAHHTVELPPRRSPLHLKQILDELRKVRPSGRTVLVDALHTWAEKARRRAMVVVASDCFDNVSALLDGFQHLRFHHHDVTLFHLLDPLELEFRFDRPMGFRDLEGGGDIVTDPAMMAREYQAELDRYLRALEHGCREFAVDYQRVRLDEDLESALARWLVGRQRTLLGSGGP